MERDVDGRRARTEAVRTLLGRRRLLAEPPHRRTACAALEAERIAQNTPIQGTAADLLKLAMVQLARAASCPGARMVLTVHDELVFEVPEAAVGEAGARQGGDGEASTRSTCRSSSTSGAGTIGATWSTRPRAQIGSTRRILSGPGAL